MTLSEQVAVHMTLSEQAVVYASVASGSRD